MWRASQYCQHDRTDAHTHTHKARDCHHDGDGNDLLRLISLFSFSFSFSFIVDFSFTFHPSFLASHTHEGPTSLRHGVFCSFLRSILCFSPSSFSRQKAVAPWHHRCRTTRSSCPSSSPPLCLFSSTTNPVSSPASASAKISATPLLLSSGRTLSSAAGPSNQPIRSHQRLSRTMRLISAL